MFLSLWLVVLCVSLWLIFCHLVEALSGGKADEASQKIAGVVKSASTSMLFITLAIFLVLGGIFSESWESPLSCLVGYVAALGIALVTGCFVGLSNDITEIGSDAANASAQQKSLEAQVNSLKKSLGETETQRDGLKLMNDELRKSLDIQSTTLKKQYDSMSKEYFRILEENERLKDLLQPHKSPESKKND